MKGCGALLFDIRTQDAAYDFVLEFLGIRGEDLIMQYRVECQCDIFEFIELHYNKIKEKDISDLKIMAFHVLGSLDDCKEIRNNGLINLQEALSRDTVLHRLLKKANLQFDIEKRKLFYGAEEFDIDYDKYRNECFLNPIEKKLCNIGHRVYYDYCVNGFLLNDDIKDYGTEIHKRPEFFNRLTEMFPEVEKLERYWKSKAVSYRVDFYVTIDQIHTFNYGVELDKISEYDLQFWDIDMEIKKWMLSLACSRAFDECDMKCLYVKDEVAIPVSQIVSISKFE